MDHRSLPSCAVGLCVATASAFLLGACGHDDGGQPGASVHPAQWARTYGGVGSDGFASVQPTAEGGFVAAGSTNSFGAGDYDAWVLKLDAGGNVIWQKTFDGPFPDGARYVQPTADGGYLVAGYKRIFYLLGGNWSGDAWVLKLDRSGNVVWQKTYGESGLDEITAGQPTLDGGFVLAGSRRALGYVMPQLRVLKIDADGALVWKKRFGGTGGEGASSVQATADGGYVVAGNTRSFGAGDADAWLLKLDADGAIPGCPYMVDADAIVADSDATTASSTVIATDANATQASGVANAADSSGVQSEQCRYP